MRSRPNSNRTTQTTQRPAPVAPHDGDCNGKDKKPVRFKRPPMAAFKLPPPPQMSSIIPQRSPNPKHAQSTPTHPLDAETDGSSVAVSAPTQQKEEVSEVTLPDFSTNETAAYKRGRHKINPPTSSDALPARSSTVAPTYQACPPVVNGSRVSYTNDLDYRNYSYTAKYKPSTWYAETQKRKQRQQYLWKLNTAVLAIILTVSLIMAFFYLRSHPEPETTGKRHRRKVSRHHHHHDFHPMVGVNEMTLEFGMAESHRHSSRKDKPQPEDETEQVNDLFSIVRVKRLSNDRLFPYVGFALASHSVEHKQIPIIVSTLLSYASSDTEGGGGIALIDCVVDEDHSKLDKGSSFYSISKEKAEKYDELEEKFESIQAETAVNIIGRAITYFGKERNRQRDQKARSNAVSVYDYENRLEIHVVVGLSGPDLGKDETIETLKTMWGSLDGLVAPFPNDLDSDTSQWTNWKQSVDYRIDVRLHVLVRPHCHSQQNGSVIPCSSDEGNADNLERFMQSYRVLERLYEGGLIDGLGLDGAHEKDVKHLLRNCEIKPQLYRGRGDVPSAFHYAPHLAKHDEFDSSIAKLLQTEDITYMASNVAGHLLSTSSVCPNAYHLLQNLGGVLYRAHTLQLTRDGTTLSHSNSQEYYSVARVILSFLVSQKVVVSPHAFKAEHLADDAPESVSSLSTYLKSNQRRLAEIGVAFDALVKGEDLPEEHGLGNEEDKVAAVFHNRSHRDVFLSKNGVTLLHEQGGTVKAQSIAVITCDSGDKFSALGVAGEEVIQVAIQAKTGETTDIIIQ